MDRFYKRAIEHVSSSMPLEISEDIKDYIKHLEFINSLLISELDKSNTFGGRTLLNKLGYKSEIKS